MSATAPPDLDFEAFHREELAARAGDALRAEAARAARPLGSLAFRLAEGGAWTYVPGATGFELRPGDDADTVIELTREIWQNVVHELDAAAGLLYGGRARATHGNAIRWVDWEPALRCLYNGRPVYDATDPGLRDRSGGPLDVSRSFAPDDDREDMAHFLRTAGFLLARDVFRPDEIAGFREEAVELAAEATKGDKLSWWGKDGRGEEVLCRVTRAAARPRLATIPEDPRMLGLVDLADEPLVHRVKGSSEQGVSLIWKRPGMSEGLGDLPWHRDCGMGGHAIMCPVLIASVFLTPGNGDTGELRFLPGSWNKGCGPIDARHPRAPRGVSFAAGPGDVALHYGDTMHAAPPPARGDLETYRLSAVTGYARPGVRPHRGSHYNEVLHRREDGQIEHLAAVAEQQSEGD